MGTGASALAAETVTAGYNNRGEPKTLTGTLGSTTYVSATSYLNWGPLSSRTYGTGTLTAQRSYGWNQTTGWLTNIATTVTNGATQTTAQNDTYGYDKMGDVREIASTAGTAQQQCYTYDGLDRLATGYTATTAAVPASIVANCGTTTANHSGGVAPYDLAYTYDSTGLGNINTVTDNTTTTPTVSTYTYPGFSDINSTTHPHAVTSVARTGGGSGTDSYGYNTNGAMNTRTVAGVTSTFTWDPQQRLASVTSGGNTTSFVYDTAGNRLLRKSPTETVLYLPGQELHLAGTVITPTRYYSCGGSVVAQRVGGSTLTWLTSDNQNSAQIAVDTTTGSFTQQRYLPFGAQRGTQGPLTGSNRSYLGQAIDPSTGLLQDGARYYDPALARFISPDPIATPYDPQNLNAYSYAANNPVSASDPSGLTLQKCADGCSGDNGSGNSGYEPDVTVTLASDSSGDPYLVVGNNTVIPVYGNVTHPVQFVTEVAKMYAYFSAHTGDPKLRFLRAAYATCGEGGSGAGGGCSAAFMAVLGEALVHRAAYDDGIHISAAADNFMQDAVATGLGLATIGMASKMGSLGGFSENVEGTAARLKSFLNEGCSFTAATKVLMADGTKKAIAKIQPGDKVLATDPMTSVTVDEPVTSRHVNNDTDMADLTITTSNGSAVLHTTQNHPFWDMTTRRWTQVVDLRVGDHLSTTEGQTAVVEKVISWTAEHDMFNLTVNQIHTYYVVAGETPVLVHNDGGDPVPPMIGANGTQLTSSTMWLRGPYRIDVENPAPGVRPGQIHFQDQSTGAKYMYNFDTGEFDGMPNSLKKTLGKSFSDYTKGITKGMNALGMGGGC